MNSAAPARQQSRPPARLSDWFARACARFLRLWADLLFHRRYAHRAVVLETVGALPGMIGGLLQHCRALRHLENDRGWIHQLIEEADNERMHLMTFLHIAQPTRLERGLIVLTQWGFSLLFGLLYVVSTRTAHRFVGYLEEEAVESYTTYLALVENGVYPDVPAPGIAVSYWHLGADARLSDVIRAVREDEAHHRDVNHAFADLLQGRPA
jgi:ubiquinol oxidase